MHTPVLLHEVIKTLKVEPNGLYVDATLGEGGYTIEILKLKGKVLGFDYDLRQIEKLKQGIKNDNLEIVNENFAEIETIAKKRKFYPVAGVIFDLGLSMDQLKNSGKGLSFKNLDEPLDMRIDDRLEDKARDLLNRLSVNEIYEILARFSEELNSGAISKAIVQSRNLKKIVNVGDLINIIDAVMGRIDEKVYRRVFQALRIAVNNEFENLEKGLRGAINILKKDGVLIVISFHSLEDRIVKNFVRRNNLRFLIKKPILGNVDLSYERSAKMRVIGL